MVAWSIAAAVLAMIVPLTLLAMREVIRRRRSTMLIDLLGTLFANNPAIPTLEFAFNKYGVHSSTFRKHNAPQKSASTQTASTLTRNSTLLLSAISYLLLSIADFALLLLPICTLVSNGSCTGTFIVPSLLWTENSTTGADALLKSAAVIVAAFLGAYLLTLRLLMRAVMNFELNPITWLRCGASDRRHDDRFASLPDAERHQLPLERITARVRERRGNELTPVARDRAGRGLRARLLTAETTFRGAGCSSRIASARHLPTNRYRPIRSAHANGASSAVR